MFGCFGEPNNPTAETTTSAVSVPACPARSNWQSQPEVSGFQRTERTLVSSIRWRRRSKSSATDSRYARISGCRAYVRLQDLLGANEYEYRWLWISHAAPGYVLCRQVPP